MEKIIKMFKNGGDYTPPFTYYKALDTTLSKRVKADTSKEDNKSEKGEFTDKDLMDMLDNLDGLPSDIQAITQDLEQYYANQNIFEREELDTNDIAIRHLQNLRKVKIANFNKKLFDASFKKVSDNGGLTEIAITQEGLLIANTEEGLQYVDVNSYLQNPEKYRLLKNSELLAYRRDNAPFDNSILEVVNNGIGIETVNELIKASANALGSNELVSSGYSKIEQGEIAEGLGYIKKLAKAGYDFEGLGLGGLRKIDALTESQVIQVEQSLNYIWRMLPNNAKTLLIVREGSPEKAISLVANMIASGSSFTRSLGVSNDLTKKESTGKAKGTDDTNTEIKTPTNPVERWLAGLGDVTQFEINIGTPVEWLVTSVSGSLTKEDGKALGQDVLSKLMVSSFNGVLDFNNIYAGNNKISKYNLNSILAADGVIYKVNLPIDKNAGNGVIRPDFDALKRIQELEKTFVANNITDPKEKNYLIGKYEREKTVEVPARYNEKTGELEFTGDFMEFGAINSIVLDTALPKDFDETFVHKLTDVNEINNIIDTYNAHNEEKLDFDVDDSLFEFGYDSMYESVIYIPVINNVFNAKNSEKISVDDTKLLDADEKLYDRQRIVNDNVNRVTLPNE